MKGLREFYDTQEKTKESISKSVNARSLEIDIVALKKSFELNSSVRYLKQLDIIDGSEHVEFMNEILSKDIHGQLYNPIINVLSTLHKQGISGEISMKDLLNTLDKIINGI